MPERLSLLEIEQKVKAVEEMTKTIQATVINMQEAIESKDTGIAAIKTATEDNEKTIGAIKKAIEAKDTGIAAIKTATENNEKTIGAIKKAVEAKDTGIAATKAATENNEKTIGAIKKAIEAEDTGIAAIKTATENNEKTIGAIKKAIEEKKTGIVAIKAATDKNQATLTALEAKVGANESAVKEALQKIAAPDLTKELEALRTKMAERETALIRWMIIAALALLTALTGVAALVASLPNRGDTSEGVGPSEAAEMRVSDVAPKTSSMASLVRAHCHAVDVFDSARSSSTGPRQEGAAGWGDARAGISTSPRATSLSYLCPAEQTAGPSQSGAR